MGAARPPCTVVGDVDLKCATLQSRATLRRGCFGRSFACSCARARYPCSSQPSGHPLRPRRPRASTARRLAPHAPAFPDQLCRSRIPRASSGGARGIVRPVHRASSAFPANARARSGGAVRRSDWLAGAEGREAVCGFHRVSRRAPSAQRCFPGRATGGGGRGAQRRRGGRDDAATRGPEGWLREACASR